MQKKIKIMFLKNDLPTAITMFLVACRSGEYQGINIDETHLNEWFSQYIGKKQS